MDAERTQLVSDLSRLAAALRDGGTTGRLSSLHRRLEELAPLDQDLLVALARTLRLPLAAADSWFQRTREHLVRRLGDGGAEPLLAGSERDGVIARVESLVWALCEVPISSNPVDGEEEELFDHSLHVGDLEVFALRYLTSRALREAGCDELAELSAEQGAWLTAHTRSLADALRRSLDSWKAKAIEAAPVPRAAGAPACSESW